MLVSLPKLARRFSKKPAAHWPLSGARASPQQPQPRAKQRTGGPVRPAEPKDRMAEDQTATTRLDQRGMRRSLYLLQRWPHEQVAMSLFRETLRSRSSRANLAIAHAAVAAVCAKPDCLRSALVPLYVLEHAVAKQFPLAATHAQTLVERTTAIWPSVAEYRSYYRMFAQQLAVLEMLRAQALLGVEAVRDFLRKNSSALVAQLRSPLLDSQAQALRSLLVLDADRELDRGLLTQLLAHLHARHDFLDLADLAVLVDCFQLASAAGPLESPLAHQLEDCLLALTARLLRRPSQSSQTGFLAALRLSRQLASLPERLSCALQSLLEARQFTEPPEPEASGFAGFFRAAQEDLPLDSLNPAARPAFKRLLGGMTQQAGLGWYKRLEPVLQVVLWRQHRLGLRSVVASPELKAELHALLDACDDTAVVSPHGTVDIAQLVTTFASAHRGPQPLDLSALVAECVRPGSTQATP